MIWPTVLFGETDKQMEQIKVYLQKRQRIYRSLTYGVLWTFLTSLTNAESGMCCVHPHETLFHIVELERFWIGIQVSYRKEMVVGNFIG